MKYLKLFENYISNRITIDNLPSHIELIEDRIDGNTFLLYDKKSETPVGYISYSYFEKDDVYSVEGVYSKRGYGPFLYETVMTDVYPKGVSLSRDGGTSGPAINIWDIFVERSDVKKERMYSDTLTHKREDLPKGMADYPEFVEHVLELEDTRFFYTYGKEKLDKIVKPNPFDEDDFMEMVYELE